MGRERGRLFWLFDFLCFYRGGPIHDAEATDHARPSTGARIPRRPRPLTQLHRRSLIIPRRQMQKVRLRRQHRVQLDRARCTASTRCAGTAAAAWPVFKGSVRLTLVLGTASTTNDNYFIIGGGVGYYILNGLEVGLDYEAWLFAKPVMQRLSPEARYVFHMVPVVKPFAGVFYRRNFITDYDDYNQIGARLGAYFIQSRTACSWAPLRYTKRRSIVPRTATSTAMSGIGNYHRRLSSRRFALGLATKPSRGLFSWVSGRGAQSAARSSGPVQRFVEFVRRSK